mgnify:FL=1
MAEHVPELREENAKLIAERETAQPVLITSPEGPVIGAVSARNYTRGPRRAALVLVLAVVCAVAKSALAGNELLITESVVSAVSECVITHGTIAKVEDVRPYKIGQPHEFGRMVRLLEVPGYHTDALQGRYPGEEKLIEFPYNVQLPTTCTPQPTPTQTPIDGPPWLKTAAAGPTFTGTITPTCTPDPRP